MAEPADLITLTSEKPATVAEAFSKRPFSEPWRMLAFVLDELRTELRFHIGTLIMVVALLVFVAAADATKHSWWALPVMLVALMDARRCLHLIARSKQAKRACFFANEVYKEALEFEATHAATKTGT